MRDRLLSLQILRMEVNKDREKKKKRGEKKKRKKKGTKIQCTTNTRTLLRNEKL